MIREGVICTGEDLLYMTVKEMESRVRVDWLESGQTRYRVIDRAVFDRTKDSHTWETRHPKTGQPQTLHVDFVAA